MSHHSLMFGWEYPPAHLGGLGIACQGLVRGLAKAGNKITLVLPRSNREEHPDVRIRSPQDGIVNVDTVHISSILQPYDTVDSYAERLQYSDTDDGDVYGENLGQAIENFTAHAVALTEDLNPDVVHTHDWMTYEAGLQAANYHRKPMVAHIHATELDRTHFKPNKWIYDKELRGFEGADRIIAVSNYTKGILVEHYGIDSGKVSVVHNGTTFAPQPYVQKPKNKPPMVLFLGRLTLQKGPVQFLKIAAAIHKVDPRVQFIMGGDGHMMAELMSTACAMGLSECLVFAGRMSKSEVQHLFAQADCFVMPSVSEPFGLVALEAVAYNTPVIVSNQSGVKEVMPHSFTADYWDTDMMADCVLTILRDSALSTQLRSQAKGILYNLTWNNQAKQVQSVYHHTILDSLST